MGRFALFGVTLCFINAVSPAYHSLMYIETGVTAGIDFPEYTSVGLVDDTPFVYYDSIIKRMIPKTEWMEASETQQYWDRATRRAQSNQQVFKGDIRTAMRRFNQTQGLHVVQRMSGCEWDDETGTTDGFNSYGYDGEDFLIFELKNTRWISPSSKGAITTHRWNDDQADLEHSKSYLTQICIEWLKKYVSYGRSSLERTVAPEVSLLQKDPSSPVVCHVTGFYPRGIMVTWQRNGEDLYDDVNLGETVPNQDGTFQTTSRLTVKDWQTENYSCTVEHRSLEKDIVKRVIEQEIRSNQDRYRRGSSPDGSGPPVGIIIGCVVGVLLALTLTGIGVMLWKKRGSGYGKTNIQARHRSSGTGSGKDTDTHRAILAPTLPSEPWGGQPIERARFNPRLQ